MFYQDSILLDEVRAVVSKRGVDDGNLKGGGSLQPAQESYFHYSKKMQLVKKKFIKIFVLYFRMHQRSLFQPI
jgi:hypothetical protein